MTPATPDLTQPSALHETRSPGRTWLTDVLVHIREEYDEMPGLCLTLPQAQRLWGLDAATCERAMASLVEMGYLRPSAYGYLRT